MKRQLDSVKLLLLIAIGLLPACKPARSNKNDYDLLNLSSKASAQSCAESSRILLANSSGRISKSALGEKFAYSKLEFSKNIQIPKSEMATIRATALEYGVEFHGNTFSELLEATASHLDGSPGSEIDHGEQMAKFLTKLRPTLGKLSQSDARHIRYLESLSVLRLEAFRDHEYVMVDHMRFEETGLKTLKLSEYEKWVRSFLQNEGPYADLEPLGRTW